jgi:hypothetical protein
LNGQHWLGALRYRVQMLAVVQGNDAIIVDEVSDNNKAQWDELPDGDYRLRVCGIDASGLEGANATKAFTVKTRPEPPELSLPKNEHRSVDEKVVFRWSVAPQAQDYRFQLAEDAEFKNLVAAVPRIAGSNRAVLFAVPGGPILLASRQHHQYGRRWPIQRCVYLYAQCGCNPITRTMRNKRFWVMFAAASL